jgi:hypothetical protein
MRRRFEHRHYSHNHLICAVNAQQSGCARVIKQGLNNAAQAKCQRHHPQVFDDVAGVCCTVAVASELEDA